MAQAEFDVEVVDLPDPWETLLAAVRQLDVGQRVKVTVRNGGDLRGIQSNLTNKLGKGIRSRRLSPQSLLVWRVKA